MTEILLSASLFSIVLTLCAFELGLFLQKKVGSPLCNPILISVLAVIAVLKLLGMTNTDYQAGSSLFSWLLTPATVCLALPLYEQIQVLKKSGRAIFAGILGGTVSSLLILALLCLAFRLNRALTVSLLPKSITTAMGIAVAQQLGGIPGITTAIIIITGILGSILGPFLCKLFRITAPIAQGVAYGTASHVIGTSRAYQVSELCGAVSSLSLVVSGIVTVLLCPVINMFL